MLDKKHALKLNLGTKLTTQHTIPKNKIVSQMWSITVFEKSMFIFQTKIFNLWDKNVVFGTACIVKLKRDWQIVFERTLYWLMSHTPFKSFYACSSRTVIILECEDFALTAICKSFPHCLTPWGPSKNDKATTNTKTITIDGVILAKLHMLAMHIEKTWLCLTKDQS